MPALAAVVMLRMAAMPDLEFVQTLAPGVTADMFRTHTQAGRFRIIEEREIPVGFLKFYVMWENLPFIEAIMLTESRRSRGIGRTAVRLWESQMQALGYTRAAISTQQEETAQHFWRKVGYADCGHIALPGRPKELFLQRDLRGRSYSLRPAEPGDMAAMMSIAHDGIRPHFEKMWPWNAQENEAGFQRHFVPEEVSIIVVDEADAGYVKVQKHGDHWYIDGIYLGSNHRSQGLGTQVLRDLMAQAQAANRPLRLRGIQSNPARALYQRLGFRVTREDATHFYMEA